MTWPELLYLALQVAIGGAFAYLLVQSLFDDQPPRPL